MRSSHKTALLPSQQSLYQDVAHCCPDVPSQVLLSKQFTHFLTVAPDPVMALQHFDRLVDRLAGDAAHGADFQWLWEEHTLKALATVLGSSHARSVSRWHTGPSGL